MKILITTLVILSLYFFIAACGVEKPNKYEVTIIQPTTAATPEVVDNSIPSAGVWSFVEDEFKTSAVVSDGSIEVMYGESGTNGDLVVFWRGTFPAKISDGDKIVSKADPSLADTLAGSVDPTLTFRYAKGKLTYKLTIDEASRDFDLRRS